MRADLSRSLHARQKMKAGFAEVRSEMRVGFKNADVKSEQPETRLTKRLFGFWIAQAATTAGLVLGIIKLT